jgi:hypothetical protein
LPEGWETCRHSEPSVRERYFLYGRSDTIVRNPGLPRAWREIGLERVFVGLEFVRDEDLAYIRKRSAAPWAQTVLLTEPGVVVMGFSDLRLHKSLDSPASSKARNKVPDKPSSSAQRIRYS